MKIVIVGNGKVGQTITEHLSKEGHDIIVIDKNPNVIEELVNTFDVMGVVGNGATLDILKEAEVGKADLLIAVTSSDELNILCCMVGKKLGVVQTIARVRDPEYSKQIHMMYEELGISMIVNPEMDAANEISRSIRFPAALKVDTFSNGKVDLVEIKLDENSPLVGKSLIAINAKYQIRMLVCAVCREDDVFIPNGDFVLNAKDKIYITASQVEIIKFLKKLDILKGKSKNVMVIGGGRISYYLAKQLEKLNVSIKLVEKNFAKCQDLSNRLSNVMIIQGDGTEHELLLEEGLQQTDALVCLTGYDEENILISMFAKSQGVEKVITKVNRSNYGKILDTAGINTVITPRDITTNHIIRYVRGMEKTQGSEFKTLYRLVNNKVEALEFYISGETLYTNIPLKDLKINNRILLACIIRDNEVIIPNGFDVIKPLDTVIVVTTSHTLKDFSDILK